MNCIVCEKKLVGQQKKFCCNICACRWRYKEKSEEYIEKAREWDKRNPKKSFEMHKKAFTKFRKEKKERFNELMKNNYQRNKTKYFSRDCTSYFIGRGDFYLKRECKVCKKKKDLQIHHEIYPTKKVEIKKAIEEGKIYYLCMTHHPRGRNSKVIY